MSVVILPLYDPTDEEDLLPQGNSLSAEHPLAEVLDATVLLSLPTHGGIQLLPRPRFTVLPGYILGHPLRAPPQFLLS